MLLARLLLTRPAIWATFLVAACAFAAIIGAALPSRASASGANTLRIQLKWFDQAQFAGFYAANDQGFFAAHGLSVQTLPGSPTFEPIASLGNGTADVAEASMAQAQNASTNGKRYVNIAQIFQQPDSVLICNLKPGTNSAADLRGARIAVSPDRHAIVAATLNKIFPDGG
jgi:NitT/TauT family transport system substrate-binding protein